MGTVWTCEHICIRKRKIKPLKLAPSDSQYIKLFMYFCGNRCGQLNVIGLKGCVAVKAIIKRRKQTKKNMCKKQTDHSNLQVQVQTVTSLNEISWIVRSKKNNPTCHNPTNPKNTFSDVEVWTLGWSVHCSESGTLLIYLQWW